MLVAFKVFYMYITNVQNPEWTQEQLEILQKQLEEQVANEEYYCSLNKPHVRNQNHCRDESLYNKNIYR